MRMDATRTASTHVILPAGSARILPQCSASCEARCGADGAIRNQTEGEIDELTITCCRRNTKKLIRARFNDTAALLVFVFFIILLVLNQMTSEHWLQ
jgi:hypothetical protein